MAHIICARPIKLVVHAAPVVRTLAKRCMVRNKARALKRVQVYCYTRTGHRYTVAEKKKEDRYQEQLQVQVALIHEHVQQRSPVDAAHVSCTFVERYPKRYKKKGTIRYLVQALFNKQSRYNWCARPIKLTVYAA